MSAPGRYCCKSRSGYEARNIDSSPGVAWQGRFKTLSAGERSLHGELIQLTFATLSAQTGPPAMSAVGSLAGEKQTLCKPHSASSIYKYTPPDQKNPRLAEVRRRIRR